MNTLAILKRQEKGKVDKIRKEGFVPGICYGLGSTSQMCKVSSYDFGKAMHADAVVFNAEGDFSGKSVLIQDVSFDPLTGNPNHVDFMLVDTSNKIEHHVQIIPVGTAPGVKQEGGSLVVAHDSIVVEGLPQDIPQHIDVSVESLSSVGSHLTAGEVEIPKALKLITQPDEILLSIVAQQEEEIIEEQPSLDSIEVVESKGKKDEPTDEPTKE